MRVIELDREQGQALARRQTQPCQRLAPGERHIAVEHQRRKLRIEMRQGLRQRMAGAQLRLLPRPDQAGQGDGLAHALAAVAVDDADDAGLEAARGIDHVRKQRPAGQRMQHLGQIRVHALALTGGEDDDVHGI